MLAGSLESATCVSPKAARLIYIIYIMRSSGLRAAFDGFCGGFALVSCLEPGWLCRLLEYFGCHLQASKTMCAVFPIGRMPPYVRLWPGHRRIDRVLCQLQHRQDAIPRVFWRALWLPAVGPFLAGQPGCAVLSPDQSSLAAHARWLRLCRSKAGTGKKPTGRLCTCRHAVHVRRARQTANTGR